MFRGRQRCQGSLIDSRYHQNYNYLLRINYHFSPHGTEIEITGDDWVSSSPETIEPSYSWDTETLKYGDLYFGRFQKKGGAKGSKQMDIMIPSIGSFQ